jgi:8-oxo-dGTP pyrophosphatase MutT (NUDIX family)
VSQILAPRAAATVLTVRDAPNGYEILMVRRNVRSEFMGGVYVFPGGALDERDLHAPVLGLDDLSASARLEVDGGGLAYYVACLRELFEEAGLLVACGPEGQHRSFASEGDAARLHAHRTSLNADETSLAEVLVAEGVVADLRDIAYFAHWITPVGPPRRYDTRFFVALAPDGQVASHDDSETTDLRWLRPRDALAARERGEIDMVVPTVRSLEAVASLERAHEVLEFAHSIARVPVVRPRAVQRDEGVVILLPGEDGYDDPTP